MHWQNFKRIMTINDMIDRVQLFFTVMLNTENVTMIHGGTNNSER